MFELIFSNALSLLFGLVPYINVKGKLRSKHRKFRRIFGEDAFHGPDFHAINTNFILRLVDEHGNRIRQMYTKTHPRQRPSVEPVPVTIDIESPVSSGGARALSYIVAAMHTNSQEPISISLDYDLDRDREEDISFISFGGPLSNWYTYYALRDEGNGLVQFRESGREGCFIDLRDDSIIARVGRNYDCGLILKFHPRQYPRRTWLVCAGFAEWGTSGAAWYLANNWESMNRRAKADPFAVVIQLDRRNQPPFFRDDLARPIWERYLHEEGGT